VRFPRLHFSLSARPPQSAGILRNEVAKDEARSEISSSSQREAAMTLGSAGLTGPYFTSELRGLGLGGFCNGRAGRGRPARVWGPSPTSGRLLFAVTAVVCLTSN
jgi:hypothetical protein